jgi:hypothetical protein
VSPHAITSSASAATPLPDPPPRGLLGGMLASAHPITIEYVNSGLPMAKFGRRSILRQPKLSIWIPPSLLATADTVIECTFRTASIDGGEMTLWVMNRRADHWLP